jgi:hypothetical protein
MMYVCMCMCQFSLTKSHTPRERGLIDAFCIQLTTVLAN